MKLKSLGAPLLIVGDNPSLPGGLARIGRDLATLACTMPNFRVAYLARGEGNRRLFPFQVYAHSEAGWGQREIAATWNDWSGGENGIILTTDDPSRRAWFSVPDAYPPGLEQFLGAGRNFQKWGYFPIDSWGPNGSTLPTEGRSTIAGYDRVLAASEWGRNVIIRGGRQDADWLPHGIFMDKLKPDMDAKAKVGCEHITLGCVMANQARKDYPAAFECAATLKADYGSQFRFWLHTDTMIRHWNVYALAADYGLADCLQVTQNLNDEQLALRYSACECTILASAGEGFGYPIAESLACGTSCIVTDYAAGQELVPEDCRVRPVTYRIDTVHNVSRAVISGYAFAMAAKVQIERKRQDWEFVSEENSRSVEHLGWDKLKTLWTRWLEEGLR